MAPSVDEQLYYYREISIFFDSSKYVLISVANLYNDIQANKVNSFLLNVEFFWSAISEDNDAMKEFWDRCNERQENTFYIITDEDLSSNRRYGMLTVMAIFLTSQYIGTCKRVYTKGYGLN